MLGARHLNFLFELILQTRSPDEPLFKVDLRAMEARFDDLVA